jgi:metal-responsive CopG/Arc/MetJ family transcriptional regulator
MKTAVSVPDEIFKDIERLARRARKSRSEVYSAALKEYVARHAPDEITETMNRVCERVKDGKDAFVAAASSRIMEHAEW